MKRNHALALLRKLKPVVAQRFGVTQLALFDSTARDEAGDNSDVNILVGFDGPPPPAVISVCNFIWKINWAAQWI